MFGKAFIISSTFVFFLPSVVFSQDAFDPPRFKFSIERFYGESFDSPTSIFIDRKNKELFVVDTGRSELLIFDTSGAPIFKFGKVQGISVPIDIVARDNRIYLSQEGKPYIQILNFTGDPVGTIAPEGVRFSPGAMDIDEDGNIYVVNKELSQCLVVDKDDRFIAVIGGSEISSLSGVAAGKDKVYLFTPFFRGRVIHAYTKKGEYLYSFEAVEERGGTLAVPVGGKVDSQGNLWVVDAMRGIVVFDKDNKELGRFAGGATQKEILNFPTDIDFDSEGMIYIMDKASKRVSVFK